ncbi:DNA polymerase II subunit B4-like [Malania oleifera]|uniref:DNA polymerase II subunit B4-like n=1 Tax=Malania oleifera TaxID=397392 RepID=UPI0025AE8257|nr:DNA polymerase II subunit B4-like [Malania oleifera]
MGYDKGSTRWYLKAAKSIQASPASTAASASASASAPNIKAKVTSLDKRVTLIEQYHAKTSKSSDPMDISSAHQSTNDDDGDDDDGDDDGSDNDDANDDDEGNSKNEGDEENTEEEGTQEEGG